MPQDARSHSAQDFDLANVEQGLKGCDAIFPYDETRAYLALRDWAALLAEDRLRLVEQLEAAEQSLADEKGLLVVERGWRYEIEDRMSKEIAGLEEQLAVNDRLRQFVECISSLDPSLGPMDIGSLVRDARGLLDG